MLTYKAIACAIAGLACLATAGRDACAQVAQPIGGGAAWQYRTEQDLAKATVHVADYTSATTSLSLHCGGLGGSYLSADIGFRAQFLPEHVNVRFEFHKKNLPADDATVEFEVGTVEYGAHIGHREGVLIVSGGLIRYDEVTVSISDPGGLVPNLRAEFPLAGAGDAVRKVFKNCDELKDADLERVWDPLIKLQRSQTSDPAKAKP